jgi:hypothetical protein
VNRVTGTYRNGGIILDQPVDWPEGMQVDVLGTAEANEAELCVDGSKYEGTSEGIKKWLDWFDSLQPVLTGEDLEQFEANLRSARDEQKALLPNWQEKTDHLVQ